MWDGTILPECSHFQVRKEACRISDERNFEPEYGIVSSHFIDHYWLFFSHYSANYQIFISNSTMAAIEKKKTIPSEKCGLMKNTYDIREL